MANNQNSSEQAQAGEVWDATELANGLSNWAHIVDNETSRLLLQRSAALLRRLAGGVTVDDAMVRRALDGQDAYWDDDALYVTCERCDGKGHHGGFGEGGHDQDWCETCGGRGSINIGTEAGAMRAALVAALGAK